MNLVQLADYPDLSKVPADVLEQRRRLLSEAQSFDKIEHYDPIGNLTMQEIPEDDSMIDVSGKIVLKAQTDKPGNSVEIQVTIKEGRETERNSFHVDRRGGSGDPVRNQLTHGQFLHFDAQGNSYVRADTLDEDGMVVSSKIEVYDCVGNLVRQELPTLKSHIENGRIVDAGDPSKSGETISIEVVFEDGRERMRRTRKILGDRTWDLSEGVFKGYDENHQMVVLILDKTTGFLREDHMDLLGRLRYTISMDQQDKPFLWSGLFYANGREKGRTTWNIENGKLVDKLSRPIDKNGWLIDDKGNQVLGGGRPIRGLPHSEGRFIGYRGGLMHVSITRDNNTYVQVMDLLGIPQQTLFGPARLVLNYTPLGRPLIADTIREGTVVRSSQTVGLIVLEESGVVKTLPIDAQVLRSRDQDQIAEAIDRVGQAARDRGAKIIGARSQTRETWSDRQWFEEYDLFGEPIKMEVPKHLRTNQAEVVTKKGGQLYRWDRDSNQPIIDPTKDARESALMPLTTKLPMYDAEGNYCPLVRDEVSGLYYQERRDAMGRLIVRYGGMYTQFPIGIDPETGQPKGEFTLGEFAIDPKTGKPKGVFTPRTAEIFHYEGGPVELADQRVTGVAHQTRMYAYDPKLAVDDYASKGRLHSVVYSVGFDPAKGQLRSAVCRAVETSDDRTDLRIESEVLRDLDNVAVYKKVYRYSDKGEPLPIDPSKEVGENGENHASDLIHMPEGDTGIWFDPTDPATDLNPKPGAELRRLLRLYQKRVVIGYTGRGDLIVRSDYFRCRPENDSYVAVTTDGKPLAEDASNLMRFQRTDILSPFGDLVARNSEGKETLFTPRAQDPIHLDQAAQINARIGYRSMPVSRLDPVQTDPATGTASQLLRRMVDGEQVRTDEYAFGTDLQFAKKRTVVHKKTEELEIHYDTEYEKNTGEERPVKILRQLKEPVEMPNPRTGEPEKVATEYLRAVEVTHDWQALTKTVTELPVEKGQHPDTSAPKLMQFEIGGSKVETGIPGNEKLTTVYRIDAKFGEIIDHETREWMDPNTSTRYREEINFDPVLSNEYGMSIRSESRLFVDDVPRLVIEFGHPQAVAEVLGAGIEIGRLPTVVQNDLKRIQVTGESFIQPASIQDLSTHATSSDYRLLDGTQLLTRIGNQQTLSVAWDRDGQPIHSYRLEQGSQVSAEYWTGQPRTLRHLIEEHLPMTDSTPEIAQEMIRGLQDKFDIGLDDPLPVIYEILWIADGIDG
ncbi:MAG: hypothetical protein WCG06_01745, partial [Candidatus Omnitrophota bacterium]